MKGMVFRELMSFVELATSAEMLEQVIEDANLPSGGAYTSVGLYDHAEAIAIVGAVAARTGAAPADLVKAFGRHLFAGLAASHAAMVARYAHCFDLLAAVDEVIHQDVHKLYPGAQTPRVILSEREDGRRAVLDYESSRPFADLAEGLLEGALAHFGMAGQARVTRIDAEDRPGCAARFIIEVEGDHAGTREERGAGDAP